MPSNVSTGILKMELEEAWKKRLAEIDMSEGEAEMYDTLLSAVAKEVQSTRVLLESREARAAERVWLPRQTDGEDGAEAS